MIAQQAWQHRHLITNGIRMHYVQQDAINGGEKPPLIIFLHGFPEFWYSWRSQLPFFAEHGYTAVAPDLRGYNDSDKPRTGYDIPTLLRDIEGLIKGLDREKAIIVGHDWGGVLAWAFAIAYPDMVERLIVIDAPHPEAMKRELRTLAQLRRSWYIFFFQLPWLPEQQLLRNRAEAVARMLRGAAGQKSAFPPEITWRYREAMLKPGAMTAALNYYRRLPWAFFRSVTGQENNHVKVPTLLLWGEKDIALGVELTTGLEQWVDDIEVTILKDCGHWVPQEYPDKVNELILNFLQE